MKSVLMALVLCCLSLQANAAESKAEMSARAAKETITRLNEQIKTLKGVKAENNFSATLSRRCDPEPEPTTCVPHCVSRYSSGACASYGSDFCGPDAVCAENCVSRYSSGACASYGSDNCGPNASCSENCVSRYSSGACASYGPDICN